jgi:Transposase DDE domain
MEKELPMGILATVGAALQQVFGSLAEEVAAQTGVIVRRRKFTAVSLARTFVLGFLHKPNASDEELARLAVQCGASVTPQAVEQRYTARLVRFLEQLFRRVTAVVVRSDRALAPLLERFSGVIILDSSTITLPDALREQYPGCGGNYGGGAAALKLQTELDLRSGALADIAIEPGRSPDGASPRQQVTRPAGSLRITDLGYFNVGVFAALASAKAYFLSRLQIGTEVRPAGGEAVAVLEWLTRQPGPYVDRMIELSQTLRLPCRLIAWRLPSEQAERRRHKLRKETRSKYGREPSAERLAWCDWTILVTNVPVELLSPPEAVVLYRARWQVELLFKRWKSQGLVSVLSGSTVVRQMARLWARLLAVVVQHWLVVSCAWSQANQSWVKVSEAIRAFVARLLAVLDDRPAMERLLAELCVLIGKTCRRNKRSKPGTVELLNDVGLLDFELVI